MTKAFDRSLPYEETSPQRFFDEYPFDWFEKEAYDVVLTKLLHRGIQEVHLGDVVLDVGCGPGRVMRFMASEGLNCFGVDISPRSLKLMRDRSGRPGVNADNLRLPFPNGVADFIVSDGVVHHIHDPRGAVLEICRVLKKGGVLYLAVYRPTGHYPLIVRWVAPPIRWLMRFSLGRVILDSTLVRIYHLVHLIKSRGKRPFRGSRNIFYGSYFGAPIIRFIGYEEVVNDWFRNEGMSLIEYEPNGGGGVHCFLARKVSK